MRADGSQPERLTREPAFDGFPVWSPSSDRILFTSKRDRNLELYLMKPDGSEQRRLTHTTAREYGASWRRGATRQVGRSTSSP